MKNAKEFNDARAAILAVNVARIACIGFGLFYAVKLDGMGVGLMVALFIGVGWLLPVTK